MADQELQHLLVQHGVDVKTAIQLQNNINGTDLIDLINSLNSGQPNSISQSNAILSRYGITLKENIMKDINWLISTAESNDIEDRLLMIEGFNYSTNLDVKLGEQLIDWLENNKVEFLTNGDGHFHIKCEDRDHAYKVGRVISGIVRKQRLVRDSSQSGEKTVGMNEKQNIKARINKAKEKLANLKPRDPNALAASMMQVKSGGPMDAQRKVDQKDKFGRAAKHKATGKWDEEIDYKIGETVLCNEKMAVVKFKTNANGEIGLIMDGKLSMVKQGHVSKLNESISGLSPIAPLFRLRELAGLPPAPNSDSGSPLSPGSVAPKFDSPDEDPVDLPMSGMQGTDMGGDDDLGGIDDLGGMPSDLPPANAAMPVVTDNSSIQGSDAMNMISDHLNNIQMQLPDIRLSEYKSLVQQLQSLTTQVQFLGKDYLGESKK